MTIEKPDPFNLRMEMKVHSKDEDRTGLGRAKEIEAKINQIAGFDFCGSVANTIQPRSKEPECVKFIITRKKIENLDLFVERLKKELGIDVKCEFNS